MGYTWDVLARKRIVLGGPGPAPRVVRRESPPPGYNNSNKEATATSGTRDRGGEAAMSGALAVDLLRERSKGASGGRSNDFSRSRAARKSPERSFISPPPNRKGGSPSRVSPGAGDTNRVRTTAAATVTTMDVSGLRFSPNGDILAAACSNVVYLYRKTAVTGVSDHGGGWVQGGGGGGGGRGGYRRYGACTGHSTKVIFFDFSRDGMALQTNDEFGELLFWDVSTAKQVNGLIFNSLRKLSPSSDRATCSRMSVCLTVDLKHVGPSSFVCVSQSDCPSVDLLIFVLPVTLLLVPYIYPPKYIFSLLLPFPFCPLSPNHYVLPFLYTRQYAMNPNGALRSPTALALEIWRWRLGLVWLDGRCKD